MCRLLGFVAPDGSTLSGALGAEQIHAFQDLARLHADGWGSAWRGADGRLRSHVSTVSASDDPQFTTMATAVPARAGIAHLRWASDRMVVRPENTHPFRADGYAFAHNGWIAEAAELDPLVPDTARGLVAGTTDSERYFALVIGAIRGGMSGIDAVAHAVSLLRGRYPAASLNALLLGPDTLVAVHASSAAEPDHQGMLDAGFTADTLPADHLDDYFTMRMRQDAAGGVTIASSGLGRDGWRDLERESVTAIDAEGRIEVRSVVPLVIG
jgi:predicted glutamine amidotransferase